MDWSQFICHHWHGKSDEISPLYHIKENRITKFTIVKASAGQPSTSQIIYKLFHHQKKKKKKVLL